MTGSGGSEGNANAVVLRLCVWCNCPTVPTLFALHVHGMHGTHTHTFDFRTPVLYLFFIMGNYYRIGDRG